MLLLNLHVSQLYLGLGGIGGGLGGLGGGDGGDGGLGGGAGMVPDVISGITLPSSRMFRFILILLQ